MIVHALNVSWDPTDASFEEGELEIVIAIQEAGTKYARKSRYDRKDTRQHSVGKMMFEEFIDDRKLQAEVNGNGHLQPVSFSKKHVMIRMIESFRSCRAVDHDRHHTHAPQAQNLAGGAFRVLQGNDADRFEAIGRLITSFRKPSVIGAANAHC